MTFTSAIHRGITGTFHWRGRASRAEYWMFLPAGLLLPVLAMAAAHALGLGFWTVVLAGLTAMLPLVAVTSRRALDGGEAIDATRDPALNLIAFTGCCWLIGKTMTYFGNLLNGADGPVGFYIAVTYWLSMLILSWITLHIFLLGLFRGTALFSQMAEPSQPGPNRYGPNPSEVQQ